MDSKDKIIIIEGGSSALEDEKTFIRKFKKFNDSNLLELVDEQVSYFLKDLSGDVLGGIMGRAWHGALKIDQLWIDESIRGKGHGYKLLKLIEKFGVEYKCSVAMTETGSFQSPEFYLKNGYEIEHIRKGYKDGITEYMLRKKL